MVSNKVISGHLTFSQMTSQTNLPINTNGDGALQDDHLRKKNATTDFLKIETRNSNKTKYFASRVMATFNNND